MGKVGIYWEHGGFTDLMQGQQITNLESETMERIKSEIAANFLQKFGTEGTFNIEMVQTPGNAYHGGRNSYRITAGDAKTTALLKKEPGWLAQFLK